MALASEILYIAEYVVRELGIGCYLPVSATANDTELRVQDVSLFDPSGGQVYVLDNDDIFTYTGISGDELTGIPSTGGYVIGGTLNEYTNANPDMVYRGELVSTVELEGMLKRYRKWVDAEALSRDVDRKKHFSSRAWFDMNAALRDDNDDSYNAVTADTISYERGTFEFTTARDLGEQLYVAGWRYNPFFTIGDFIEQFAQDERWTVYSQIGQTARSKKDARALADSWRAKGKWF
ncbi:MAG: hypothetical protein ACE5I1_19545 [bacterium]